MKPVDADGVAESRTVRSAPDLLEVRRMLADVRPELAEDSVAFSAGVLLLIGPAASFNVDRMAGRGGIRRHVVAACTRRLFDNGVWQASGPTYGWQTPQDEKFWLDVSVAEGQLCRRTDPLGRIEWAAPGEWRKPYGFQSVDGDSLSVSYFKEPVVVEAAIPDPPTPAVKQPEINRAEKRAEPVIVVKPEPVAREREPVPLGAGRAAPVWLGNGGVEQPFPEAVWLM